MASGAGRDRSRSPKRSKKSSGGFKWKEKPRKTDEETESTARSYRERSPKYDSRPRDEERGHRSSDDRRERRRSTERHRDYKDEDRKERRRDEERANRRAPREEDAGVKGPAPVVEAPVPITDKKSVAAKFGAKAAAAAASKKNDTTNKDTAADGTPLSSMAAPKYTGLSSAEPMIVVHVNDRLGTKAAIPCLASDPVRAFKAMVAARIGRQPHEIMLKRQGERPFKDQLTLEDYGVSNGVQLDLELDTGE